MRQAIVLLALLAGTGSAQWQRFGARPPANAPASLSRDMLALHNAARAGLRIPPLVWSKQLAARSQTWADTLLSRRRFEHSPNSPYGENLFEIIGATASPAQVVQSWTDESRHYDYRANTCTTGECGHYTQIVWRDTKAVGCAVARDRGREVWVCTYDPPGNWVGARPY